MHDAATNADTAVALDCELEMELEVKVDSPVDAEARVDGNDKSDVEPETDGRIMLIHYGIESDILGSSALTLKGLRLESAAFLPRTATMCSADGLVCMSGGLSP